MSALLDTDVWVHVSRDASDAVGRLRRHASEETPYISVITQMELTVGCRNKSELRKLGRFLKGFRIIKLDGPTCDRAVSLLERYRLSHGLAMADGLIAATALVHGLPLISGNRKHYRSSKVWFCLHIHEPAYRPFRTGRLRPYKGRRH